MVDSLMSRTGHLAELRSASPVVLPSLLLCDFGHLEREIRRLEEANVQAIHLDVMDGHFVPNLSFGLTIVETARRVTNLTLDVHLMISNPGEYLSRYVEAGADLLTVHTEVVADARPLLAEIRSLGAGAGLALNPPTPVASIEPALPACDFVLVMSVMPGFGGQEFDEVALEKLRAVRAKAGDSVLLEVDGGVNEETISACVEAGADLLVVGSAITGHGDYRASVSHLTQLAHAAV
jgi:ribulose-phosphate 3-epimerase